MKAFWEAVEQRLAQSSVDDLRQVLRAMAKEVSPNERRAFLQRLGPVESPRTGVKAPKKGNLLGDIRQLEKEVEKAFAADEEGWYEDDYYDEYDEYDGFYDDEDSLGPYERFVEPLNELFDRVQATFDDGDLPLARSAYESLFDIFRYEDDYGRGLRLEHLSAVDPHETCARYLRAVYESEPLDNRAAALSWAMSYVRELSPGSQPRFEDLIQITPNPLPDQAEFSDYWIAYLRDRPDRFADALLREAIRFTHGVEGLRDLARSEGVQRPYAFLDWCTALAEAGDQEGALAAAEEALHTLPEDFPIRAAIADVLCVAAAELGDKPLQRYGRWEAFAARPTLERLVDLWEIQNDPDEKIAVMGRAADYARAYRRRSSKDQAVHEFTYLDPKNLNAKVSVSNLLDVHARLLAGNWQAVKKSVGRQKVLGWSSSSCGQGLLVGFLLASLSGGLTDLLDTNLARFWRNRLSYSLGRGYWYEDQFEDDPLLERLKSAYDELLPAISLGERDQEECLAWCLEIANQRVDSIVGNKHRKSYNKAALVITACAETVHLRGDPREARRILDSVCARFARHTAFQREMKQTMKVMTRGMGKNRGWAQMPLS